MKSSPKRSVLLLIAAGWLGAMEHNLGLYYEKSFEKLMRFLGGHLKS